MKAIDKAKRLLLRLLGTPPASDNAGTLLAKFQRELDVAIDYEAREFQAAALGEIAAFHMVPADSTYILYPNTMDYPQQVFGPFKDEEEAKAYIEIKKSRQRPNHQQWFAQGGGVRHDGDLFIVGMPQFVKKADVYEHKMREFLNLSKGIAFDRSLWEVETYKAMGMWDEADGETPRGAGAQRATLADAIKTVVIHAPKEALDAKDA